MEPKIIFSTPIYGTPLFPRARYCMEQIYSIKKQLNPKQYLHIIVNDGSSDNTKAELSRYAKTDPNIILINQEHTNGTFAFNLGIDVSISPERHQDLLSNVDYQKITSFDASLVSFIGVDDLYGPGLSSRINKACNYSSGYKLFLGHYRSFIAQRMSSRIEHTLFDKNIKQFFKKLFYVENFPSHTIIWRKDFLLEIKKARGYNLGVIDPNLLSPIVWDLMLYATQLAIEKHYKFGLIRGNTGYKRYGISGTMTEKNKKAGRYLKEREVVFKRYIQFAKSNSIINLNQRPLRDKTYFNPLFADDPTRYDRYLASIVSLDSN